MNMRKHRGHTRSNAQRGVTMLEVLVTLLIITLWLLGTAGAQSAALKLTKAAQFRTSAVFLASEIAERMEANGATASTGAYECAGSACFPTTKPKDCVGSMCTGPELATFDRWDWGTRVTAALPSATATITFVAPAYTITIGWTDRGDSRTTGATETPSYVATKTINPS